MLIVSEGKETDMKDIVTWMNSILTDKLGMAASFADTIDVAIAVVMLIGTGLLCNWLCQILYKWITKHNGRLRRSKWYPFLSKRKLGSNLILLVPGVLIYSLIDLTFGSDPELVSIMNRFAQAYITFAGIRICNSLMMAFLDFYSTTDKNRSHPLRGLVQGVQVLLFFIGGIVIIAILLGKSPTILLTGLGASAAVLMLIFKDSILGFVAGVQLSQNNMVRIGDWIQTMDGSANGTVEEITLNTVKVRNWDNTLSMIPPYTLVSTPFKNWRGMQESGGRRVDKCIYIDMTSIETCSDEMLARMAASVPVISGQIGLLKDAGPVSNIQVYRAYIETYLRQHPDVNTELDLIITQKEATSYGLPIEIYFFTKEKSWALYEKKQSDIFDHIISMAPDFGLKLYQRP